MRRSRGFDQGGPDNKVFFFSPSVTFLFFTLYRGGPYIIFRGWVRVSKVFKGEPKVFQGGGGVQLLISIETLDLGMIQINCLLVLLS